MKRIAIIPVVREIYKKQYEASVDIKLIKFLNKVYKKNNIEIIFDDKKFETKKYDLLVITGGNSLLNKTKHDKIRHSLTQNIIKKALKTNILIFGICYGAQILAKNFESKLIFNKRNHIGYHTLKINNKLILVNSYHNTVIKKLGKDLISIGVAKDNTIEFFRHKKKRIIGIMWHPERYKKIKKIDQKIFQNKW